MAIAVPSAPAAMTADQYHRINEHLDASRIPNGCVRRPWQAAHPTRRRSFGLSPELIRALQFLDERLDRDRRQRLELRRPS
jgi:hypothetical protein